MVEEETTVTHRIVGYWRRVFLIFCCRRTSVGLHHGGHGWMFFVLCSANALLSITGLTVDKRVESQGELTRVRPGERGSDQAGPGLRIIKFNS
jgi:hypothetical protein